MKRKALSLILAFAMAVSLFTVGASAAEPTYGDTAGHWAEASIERWSGAVLLLLSRNASCSYEQPQTSCDASRWGFHNALSCEPRR